MRISTVAARCAEAQVYAGARLTSDLLLLVLSVLDTSGVDNRLVGEDQATLLKILVARPQHRVQHALVQQKVAHPLRDDDVDLRKRQLHLLHLALQQRDLVLHAVDLDNLLCFFDDGRVVDCDDVLCTGFDGEHAQDRSSAADVEDDLVFEEVLVLVDCVAIGSCAHFVFLVEVSTGSHDSRISHFD